MVTSWVLSRGGLQHLPGLGWGCAAGRNFKMKRRCLQKGLSSAGGFPPCPSLPSPKRREGIFVKRLHETASFLGGGWRGFLM